MSKSSEDENKVPHPGAFVKREIIKPSGLNVNETADLLGIRNSSLSKIIIGESDLSLEMCCRLEILFGANAEELATMQMLYDLEKAREKVKRENLKPYMPE